MSTSQEEQWSDDPNQFIADEDDDFFDTKMMDVTELLRKQGLNVEAYDFLKNLHTELPNTPYAQKGIILERILDLEKTLKIPFRERFMPSKNSLVD